MEKGDVNRMKAHAIYSYAFPPVRKVTEYKTMAWQNIDLLLEPICKTILFQCRYKKCHINICLKLVVEFMFDTICSHF